MESMTRRFVLPMVIVISLETVAIGSSSPIEVSALATAKGLLFAGTYSGKVLVSPDSGLNWSDASQGLCDTSSPRYQKMIKCLKVTVDDSIHAITSCGEFASAVTDVHWKLLSADSCIYQYCPRCITNMEYSARVNEWMIKSFITGPIEWSKDTGKTWTVSVPGCAMCSMPIINCLYFDAVSALAGLNGGYGSKIGYTANIIVSTDSGRTWRATALTGTSSGVSSIARLGLIAFAGAQNGIYASRDNFSTWWLIGANGCGKGAAGTSKAALRLTEIRKNGTLFQKFTYDPSGKIIADSSATVETFGYDSLGRCTKRNYSGFEETYAYGAGGELVSKTRYFPATSKTWLENYHRGPDGAIRSASTFYNGDSSGYTRIFYDCSGNTVERSDYDKNNVLVKQEICGYDSMVNPLRPSFPLEISRKANIVSSYYYSIAMSSPPQTYKSSFTYNVQGFPVRETRVYSAGSTPTDSCYFDYLYEPVTVQALRPPSVGYVANISFLDTGPGSVPAVGLNLAADAAVSVSVYDLAGRRIAEVLHQTTVSAGSRRVPLSFTGKSVSRARGIYFCVVNVGAMTQTFKVPEVR